MVKQFQTSRNSALIFNWVFIVGLIVLALNDQYLKWTFGNWATGKISDFAGLLIFPMFLQFLFPSISRVSVMVTGALFVFWKLPISGSVIHIYNKIALIPITRTVDYSDFVALLILPLSWYLIGRIDSYRIGRISPAFAACLIAMPAALVFMATSPPISFYMQPGGDVHIGKSYRLKVSEDEALARFKAIGFTVVPDRSQHESGRADYYLMKNVVLNGGKDTIETIQFGFLGNSKKPLLLINNVKLKKGSTLTDLEGLKKYYRKLIRSGIVNEVK
ncbi:hypothetical protein [Mucilaginibacter sp.]|uniref:hypothetical protein n=1 Tax=Mucilaginibacter sp. TaxID=1882438 RepID=UPI0025E0D558|nr:hypothetical protein [Mucilaginibacter sp.]